MKSIKFATDVVKEMDERGSISVPENCITGEAYEEWLYGSDKKDCDTCRKAWTDDCELARCWKHNYRHWQPEVKEGDGE